MIHWALSMFILDYILFVIILKIFNTFLYQAGLCYAGLVLCRFLLLFMPSYSRKISFAARRLLQHQQLAEDGRNLASIGFITGSIGYLNLQNGHHFDDHPLVHFPLYKPDGHYFPRGEAPPPYDEAVADTPLNISYSSQFLTSEWLIWPNANVCYSMKMAQLQRVKTGGKKYCWISDRSVIYYTENLWPAQMTAIYYLFFLMEKKGYVFTWLFVSST